MSAHLSGYAVWAALLAGVAAALLVPSPARQLGRTRSDSAAPPAHRGLLARQWLAARPDAAPLRRRVAVALAGSCAFAAALHAVGVPGLLAGVAALLLASAVAVALGKLEPTEARRRRERLLVDLPQALELMSACLLAGMPIRSAVRAVAGAVDGPVGDDLSQVLALMHLGTSDAEAWMALRSSDEWRPTAVDLARSFDSGTRTVEVLLEHARGLRGRRRALIEVSARAVGVRSVLPLMICFLPAFVLVGVVPTVGSALMHAFG